MATPEFDHSLKLRAAFPADVVGKLRVELAVCEQLPDAFEALLAKLAFVGFGVHLPIFLLVVIVPDVTQQVGEFELTVGADPGQVNGDVLSFGLGLSCARKPVVAFLSHASP